MATGPIKLSEFSAASTEPMAGPAEPVASALTAPDRAHPSFTHPGAVAAIVGGYHSTPFDILGIHRHTVGDKRAIVIRTFQPQAQTVSVLRGGQLYPMRRVHQDGFFEVALDNESEFFITGFPLPCQPWTAAVSEPTKSTIRTAIPLF